MKAVAGERRRFGYRRIHVMLERQGIVMNLKKLRRLYREERLGQELSERLQRLADAHDQPLELIMKGLRARVADRFRSLALGMTKPAIPEPETGGKSIRYATSLSGDLAENLNAWFDPFCLGVAKDACKPILIGLFQEEARALCEGVGMPQTDHPR